MWMEGWINPAAPLFSAARASAANVPQPGEHGEYTAEMFWQDFPQFTKTVPPESLEEGEENGNEGEENGNEGKETGESSKATVSLVPEAMLALFIQQANDSVLPSRWGSMWRYAAGLYTAHFASLYLKPYASGSENTAQAAGSADQTGVVKSASMGDTSISYDNSAITAGTEKWGTWNATQYGSQLITMARMVGMGGMYAI